MTHHPHNEVQIGGITYRLIYRLRPARGRERWIAVADGADVTTVLEWRGGEWEVDKECGR